MGMDNVTNKKCLISQSAGIGDIIFTRKIYKHFKNIGYDVIYPINNNFIWINDYINNCKYISENSDFDYKNIYNSFNKIDDKNLLYLPIKYADRHYPNLKIMESKYKMVGLDYSDWVEYFDLIRNHKKENDLFYNKLLLSEDEEFILVSRNYGSPPNYLKFPIYIKSTNKIVEMDFIEGYTLFDWCLVLEKAKEIHMIDSSINFLIDFLKLDKEMYLYSRRKNNFSEIDYLFNAKYNLIY